MRHATVHSFTRFVGHPMQSQPDRTTARAIQLSAKLCPPFCQRSWPSDSRTGGDALLRRRGTDSRAAPARSPSPQRRWYSRRRPTRHCRTWAPLAARGS
eukprot:scaffold270165_cov30-Tisochrysis_lutea.AAC.2